MKNKISYPNYDAYIYAPMPYDINKWLKVANDLKYYESKGQNRLDLLGKMQKDWSEREKDDFKAWLRFYEEGTHMKYKKAQQMSYESPSWSGYYLPNAYSPNAKTEEPQYASDVENKKEIIESQRKKIISRLDSVEKLLRTEKGHVFAGGELENLIDIIYQLKKKINTVNKTAKSSRIYEDMIVREANILSNKGFTKSAEYLFKVAQNTVPLQAMDDKKLSKDISNQNPELPAAPAGTTTQSMGLPGQPVGNTAAPGPVGSAAPGTTPTENNLPGDIIFEEEIKQKEGIEGFLENLEQSGISTLDNLEVEDDNNADVLYVEDFVSTAQAAPPAGPKAPAKAPSADEPAGAASDLTPRSTNLDAKIKALYQSATMTEIINEINMVYAIFAKAEIPRRLSRIEEMLNAKGLAPYVAELREAQTKALESNQYISTRLETVMANISGSVNNSEEIDLTTPVESNDPQANAIKNDLIQDDQKEKARKKMKKDLENQSLEQQMAPPAAESPELEVEEEFAPAAPAAEPTVKPPPPPPAA